MKGTLLTGFVCLTAAFYAFLEREALASIDECPTTSETITVNDNALCIETVSTDIGQERGLQNITSIPDTYGMLFSFEEEQEVRFWMHKTYIPLDIVFFDEDFCVEKISKDTVPHSKSIISSENTQFVLEVNAEQAEQIGFKQGQCYKKLSYAATR